MATASSPAHFLSQNFAVNKPHRKVAGARFQPVRISAACATTTAEEPTGWPPEQPSSSLYEVLGIRIGATCQEIKSAYRRLARIVHPDVAASDSTALEFVKIHDAYSTLLDPEKRADYDRMLFGRRFKAVNLRSETSIFAYPTAAGPSSGFRDTWRRRTWETDQCW